MKEVEWGEFVLENLFDSSNGDFDIQKNHINNKGCFVVTAGLSNYGILGKSDIGAKIFNRGTFTIDMFGNVFFRQHKYKMVTHARVFSLTPKISINDNQGLFLSTIFHFLNKKFGYENMCSWEKIKKESILLPIRNNKVDFEFMNKFIAELEAERLAELEAYLSVTGLNNYTLTEEEQKVLKGYDNLIFKDVHVPEFFEIKNTCNILSTDIVKDSGEYPYLCASTDNNAVSTYISYDKQYMDKGNCIFIGGKTFVVTYQEKDFFSNDSHNLTLRLKEESKRSKDIQLYIATCVNKSLGYKYSWGDSISSKKIKNDVISLPHIGKYIDYDSMPVLISAIKKLVIKDVVLYTDKKLKQQKIINKE